MKRAILSMLILVSALCKAQTVEEKSLKSDILGCEKRYCIYLPQGYEESNIEYPVLYLLHGLTDNNTAWR
ncbi:MAG: esterase family protein, partial [Bacteroidaceae bacterium]|nr:esterase family protein [Bacteroidaceae bacterium]